jgi:LemA protein
MHYTIWIIVGAVVLIGLWLWSTYNGLVTLNERVEEAWSDITIQLKRRADLIPNIIETVKGYAKHEREVFEGVTMARAASISPESMKSPKAAAKADAGFAGAMKSLFAVAEAYPQLQANQQFLGLQSELSDTEDKIMSARRFYNAGARELNIKIKQFPQVLFAGLGFKQREYFEVADAAAIQDAPQVKF